MDFATNIFFCISFVIDILSDTKHCITTRKYSVKCKFYPRMKWFCKVKLLITKYNITKVVGKRIKLCKKNNSMNYFLITMFNNWMLLECEAFTIYLLDSPYIKKELYKCKCGIMLNVLQNFFIQSWFVERLLNKF